MLTGTLNFQDGKLVVINPQDIFYNDLPSDVAGKWAGTLQEHSGCLGSTTVTHAAWDYIPATWVLCEKDQTKPMARQIALGEIMGEGYTIERLDCGHTPFLSMPEKVVELIVKIADE